MTAVADLIDDLETRVAKEAAGSMCVGLVEVQGEPNFLLLTKYGEMNVANWAYLRRRLREVFDGDAALEDVYSVLYAKLPMGQDMVCVYASPYVTGDDNHAVALRAAPKGGVPLWVGNL